MSNTNEPQHHVECWGPRAVSLVTRYLEVMSELFIVFRVSEIVKTDDPDEQLAIFREVLRGKRRHQ